LQATSTIWPSLRIRWAHFKSRAHVTHIKIGKGRDKMVWRVEREFPMFKTSFALVAQNDNSSGNGSTSSIGRLG